MNIHQLPQNLKEAIASEESFKILQNFWYQYKLSDKQQQELGYETGLYLLGETKSDRFVPNLMYHMDITRSVAEEIKERIDSEIVEPVRASFERMQQSTIENTTEEVPVEPIGGVEYQEQDTSDTSSEAPLTTTSQEIPTMSVEENVQTPRSENASPQETADLAPTSTPEMLKNIENMANEEHATDTNLNLNHAPLNIIKDDVLSQVEDPDISNKKIEEVENEQSEGSELDQKLDQILKGPRKTPPTDLPPNLPVDPEPTERTESQHIETPTPPQQNQHHTSPKAPTQYEANKDPYREPIE